MYNLLTAVAGDKERIDVLKGTLLLTARAKETAIRSISLLLAAGAAAIVRGIKTCRDERKRERERERDRLIHHTLQCTHTHH